MAGDWLTIEALVALRGRTERSAQQLLVRFEATGWPRVRRVPSRRGKPRLEVHAGDYERFCEGFGPPIEAADRGRRVR